MNEKDKDDLYYVCSLIEYLGRVTKNHRSTIIQVLGKEEIVRQLDLAEVNHCLSFEQVADELIEYFNIKEGEFDTEIRMIIEKHLGDFEEYIYSVNKFLNR